MKDHFDETLAKLDEIYKAIKGSKSTRDQWLAAKIQELLFLTKPRD